MSEEAPLKILQRQAEEIRKLTAERDALHKQNADFIGAAKEIRDAALEEAAMVCVQIANRPSNVVLGVAITCAEAINNLKENRDE